jgi:MoaA/NifB/PqqE/SkfB family radical SAM enzyme
MSMSNDLDFFVQWHFTEKCNLKCAHCYQTGKGSLELSLEEITLAIQEISHTLKIWSDAYDINFSPSVNITGGEPFLRKDLLKIIGEFKNAGFDTYLLTNGILIDKEKALNLSHEGVKGVQVSIEGPEHIHNSIRGKNSFSASMRGIENLLESDLTVTLNATLSRHNSSYLLETIDLASNIGAHRLGFSRLVPSGKGEQLLKNMLKTGEVSSLYNDVFSHELNNGLEIVTGDPVASQMRNGPVHSDLGDIPLGGCAAGISGITIMPDGSVVP